MFWASFLYFHFLDWLGKKTPDVKNSFASHERCFLSSEIEPLSTLTHFQDCLPSLSDNPLHICRSNVGQYNQKRPVPGFKWCHSYMSCAISPNITIQTNLIYRKFELNAGVGENFQYFDNIWENLSKSHIEIFQWISILNHHSSYCFYIWQ